MTANTEAPRPPRPSGWQLWIVFFTYTALAALIVQTVLLPGIWDTQCGFKLFRGDVAHRVFASLITDGFGYDPEVLYRARKQGVRIAEVPVVWRNSAETKVSPLRSSLDMFKHVIRLRFIV